MNPFRTNKWHFGYFKDGEKVGFSKLSLNFQDKPLSETMKE